MPSYTESLHRMVLELENTVEELYKEVGEVKRHLEGKGPPVYGLDWEHGRERDDD